MITKYIEPHDYNAVYSPIITRIKSDNLLLSEQFKYVICLTYNNVTYSSYTLVTLDNKVYTKITTIGHNYKLGETVLLLTSDKFYDGIYIIKSVLSSTEFIIDLVITKPLSGVTSISNVIKYNYLPDLDGEAKLNISNTVRNFVSSTLIDSDDIYDGASTKMITTLYYGEDKQYSFTFTDNGFDSPSGFTTFYNPSIISLSDVPFVVGDKIVIEQDLTNWVYTDNFFSSGNLGFTSTNPQSFKVGQQINVTGQISEQSYNGVTTIKTIVDDYNIVTNKPFTNATPAEGGSIFGYPRPKYNTTAKITRIYLDMTYGVVIVTDIVYDGNSVPISGVIKYADNRNTILYNESNSIAFNVYNAHQDNIEYSKTFFDKYVIQNRSASLNNYSTILSDNSNVKYRIEVLTKSWILAHVHNNTYCTDALFKYYNKAGTMIASVKLQNNSINKTDYYIPVGIQQVLNSLYYTNLGPTDLDLVIDEVAYYTLEGIPTAGTPVRTKPITFELNNDCASYDIYHLLWKDKYGSLISYPFIYIANTSIELNKKTYYKTSGNFNMTTNTFGYNTYDRGKTTYNSMGIDKIIVNSGWVEDFENVLIKDLLLSTEVFIQRPDNVIVAANIMNSNFEFKKSNNDMLYQYSLELNLSNDIQRF